MKKPAIPKVSSGNAAVDRFAAAVKQSLDTQTGQHQNTPLLPQLGPAATTAEIIAAYNALLERVQGS